MGERLRRKNIQKNFLHADAPDGNEACELPRFVVCRGMISLQDHAFHLLLPHLLGAALAAGVLVFPEARSPSPEGCRACDLWNRTPGHDRTRRRTQPLPTASWILLALTPPAPELGDTWGLGLMLGPTGRQPGRGDHHPAFQARSSHSSPRAAVDMCWRPWEAPHTAPQPRGPAGWNAVLVLVDGIGGRFLFIFGLRARHLAAGQSASDELIGGASLRP